MTIPIVQCFLLLTMLVIPPVHSEQQEQVEQQDQQLAPLVEVEPSASLGDTSNIAPVLSAINALLLGDDDPTMSINDVSLTEGNSGTKAFTFTVTLSQSPTSTVTVNYGTGNGTATSGSDYTATSGTLTFAAGETSKTITVNVIGDTTFEPDETFVINLFNPSSATIADGQGQGTIQNDDVSTPSITINDVSSTEGNSGTKAFTFTVTLSQAATSNVTVNYATTNGTAASGSDYTATSGTLTFTAGQTSKTITVNVMGDTVVEPNETFFVNLTSPTNATLSDAQGQGTIQNDDVSTPSITINDVSSTEGNSGTKAFTFTVTLSRAATSNVTVNYATADGTAATSGSDYTATSGTLTFTAGQTSKTVTVNVIGDTAIESNETFFVNLTSPTNATLSDAQGQGTIQNDDGVSLGEAVDNLTLTWTSSGDALWTGQTTTSYSGGDAAQSGIISDYQQSTLQTTVTGPKTLTFYWKVSSEASFDYLRFYLDASQPFSGISGEVGWQQKTVTIPTGQHILKWTYSKDDSLSEGSDRGWVDLVR